MVSALVLNLIIWIRMANAAVLVSSNQWTIILIIQNALSVLLDVYAIHRDATNAIAAHLESLIIIDRQRCSAAIAQRQLNKKVESVDVQINTTLTTHRWNVYAITKYTLLRHITTTKVIA